MNKNHVIGLSCLGGVVGIILGVIAGYFTTKNSSSEELGIYKKITYDSYVNQPEIEEQLITNVESRRIRETLR